MDSLGYSELLMKIGKRLMRIAEGAESAADGDIDGAERSAAIEAARARLVEYDEALALVAKDSTVLARQFVDHFVDDIDLIRASLLRIDSGGHGEDSGV